MGGVRCIGQRPILNKHNPRVTLVAALQLQFSFTGSHKWQQRNESGQFIFSLLNDYVIIFFHSKNDIARKKKLLFAQFHTYPIPPN